MKVFALLTLFPLVASMGPGCNSTCQGKMQELYLEEVKVKLLRGLGLHSIPPAPSTMIPEEEIMALYGDPDEPEELEPPRTIITGKGCEMSVLCTKFKLSRTTGMAPIEKAFVSVYLDMSLFENSPVDGVTVRIYRRLADGTVGEQIAEQQFNVESSQRVQVEIPAEEVQNFNAEDIIGLYFEALVGETNVAVHPEQAVQRSQIPFLTLEMQRPKVRSRRSNNQYCGSNSDEKGCCLHDMIIDFKKMGWKFVMAPAKYNAFMCRGDCRLNHHHLTRFSHTKLVMDTKKAGEAHCCHPSDYDSLKVIYTRQDNEIIVTRVPGLIASRCTCT